MLLKKTVNPREPDHIIIQQAVEVLADSQLIIYPTDTLYGLAVDPRSSEAVEKLFLTKARPPKMAIPLIASDIGQVQKFAGSLTPLAYRLARRFWPGPLTLVIDARPTLSKRLLGGGNSVAIRVPDHKLARLLAQNLGHPVTATSANLTGKPVPMTARDAVVDLSASVELVLDGGPTLNLLPSTIVDARSEVPILIRNGVVKWDCVLESLS